MGSTGFLAETLYEPTSPPSTTAGLQEEMKTVLITNGNLSSMIALGGWLERSQVRLEKIFVTYRLPSSKGNLSGLFHMLKNSGIDYTFLKVWINRLAPQKIGCGSKGILGKVLGRMGRVCSVEDVATANAPEVIEQINKIAPDILLSFSATHRFSNELLSTPRIAGINVHYGALPRYGGLSPYFWHLYNEEPSFGVTVHKMVPALDAGPIVKQNVQSAENETTSLGLLLKMANQVSPLLIELFDQPELMNKVREQDLSDRSYYGHPNKAQVREFFQKGYRLMNSRSRHDFLKRGRDVLSGG